MDELMELRQATTNGCYSDALHTVDELGETAREDKADQVFSYMTKFDKNALIAEAMRLINC